MLTTRNSILVVEALRKRLASIKAINPKPNFERLVSEIECTSTPYSSRFCTSTCRKRLPERIGRRIHAASPQGD